MLERVNAVSSVDGRRFLKLSTVKQFQQGEGCCFVYNATVKRTRQGKPFVTLFIRDIDGNTAPGYIFDLASPLLAGGEAKQVVGRIVYVCWTENYLEKIGLTLILDDVKMMSSVDADVMSMFTGGIADADAKEQELKRLFTDNLNINISLPPHIKTYSSPEYMQGRVGGLLEFYHRMGKVLDTTVFLPEQERSILIATFAIYICVHAAYVRANDSGDATIDLVTTLTNLVSRLDTTLKTGSSGMEVIHMFFGYAPTDVYVRTISNIADWVQRTDREFALYRTIPMLQEGDAGYGKIRRLHSDDI